MTKDYRPSYMRVPETAHPLIKQLFEQMDKKAVSLSALEERSGIDRSTISAWRHRQTVTLVPLEQCLRVFDLHLIAVQYPQATLQAAGQVSAMKIALDMIRRDAENILKLAKR